MKVHGMHFLAEILKYLNIARAGMRAYIFLDFSLIFPFSMFRYLVLLLQWYTIRSYVFGSDLRN